MEIEDLIEGVLLSLRREMASEGGTVRLVRLDGQIAFVELGGPRSLSWTVGVTAALQSRLPQLTVMTSLCAAPRVKDAGTSPELTGP